MVTVCRSSLEWLPSMTLRALKVEETGATNSAQLCILVHG